MRRTLSKSYILKWVQWENIFIWLRFIHGRYLIHTCLPILVELQGCNLILRGDRMQYIFHMFSCIFYYYIPFIYNYNTLLIESLSQIMQLLWFNYIFVWLAYRLIEFFFGIIVTMKSKILRLAVIKTIFWLWLNTKQETTSFWVV